VVAGKKMKTMKDYYRILDVAPDAVEDEIKRKYRKMAMQYHPDRNPDDPGAEEKFKEIAEAYGVLTDPVKRREYDAARASGSTYQANGTGGFSYTQDEILQDLFRDPRFQQMFQSILREFQRAGFRASPQFIRKSFFGGRGGLFFGGLFFIGSLAAPAIMQSARRHLPDRHTLIRRIGKTVGSLLGGTRSSSEDQVAPVETRPGTIVYKMALSAAEMREGKVVRVVSPGPEGQELLQVVIPPGSHAGQKLRLRGKGEVLPEGRGDLYLLLEQQ